MRYFTKKWWHECCVQRSTETDEVFSTYMKHLDKLKNILPKKLVSDRFNMHDSILLRRYFSGNDYIMEFDFSKGFGSINMLRFANAIIIEEDKISNNSVWEYHEFYLIEGKLEVHILFSNSEQAEQIIIRSDDIDYREGYDERAVSREKLLKDIKDVRDLETHRKIVKNYFSVMHNERDHPKDCVNLRIGVE